MADAENTNDKPAVVEDSTLGVDAQKQESSNEGKTVSDVEKRLAELEAELTKTREILDKARKGEKFAKKTKDELEAQLKEQGKYKELYEQTEAKLKALTVDSVLAEAARTAKAKNVAAVLKLVDRSKIEMKDGVADAASALKAIEAIRAEVGELFEQVQTPTPARAAETQPIGGYEKEIRTARTIKDIEAVLKKYNKI